MVSVTCKPQSLHENGSNVIFWLINISFLAIPDPASVPSIAATALQHTMPDEGNSFLHFVWFNQIFESSLIKSKLKIVILL